MRILLINPNTSPDITALVAGHARRMAGRDVEIRAVTGRFGARYIASRAAAAIAAHAALDAFATHGEGCDAVLLACFGDPGLLALRELSPVPVVGMAEASLHLACQTGQRVSIVTGGERWGAMLTEFASGLGLRDRLASVRTVPASGAAIAADPEGSLATLGKACRACADDDRADAVILGGAGLAGLAERIAPALPVPLICSLTAGVAAALAAGRLRLAKPAAGSLAATPPVETLALSRELARMLSARDG